MSLDCIRLVVVAVTLLLSDVTCQTVHSVSISHDVHSGRQRRQAVKLTQAVISGIVDRHNALRASEGAANMELMVWGRKLASRAASHAKRCTSEHDPGPDGQNIGGGGNPKNLAPKINKWYIEKVHYTLDTHKCSGGKCGHYKQVVWASSRYVGCAFRRCPSLPSRALTICNYWPAGNYKGVRPYVKGPACSKCASGAGWCKNKLCNWQCTSAGEGCSCAAICYNCATLDLETCRCKCAKGWHGTDCSVRCKDAPKWCGRNGGYPYKSLCNEKAIVRIRCPGWCGVCEADLNATEGLCPPVRGPAADSAQTMFINIHQSTMIFVIMVIIAFTIIGYDAL